MGIVSLSPSLTGILTALKASEDLLELDSKAMAVSKIEALAPEWILADARDNRPEEIEVFRRRWRTKLFEVKSWEDVCDVVAELGRCVKRREEAQQLNQSIREEILINEKLFWDRQRKRTVLLLWDQPFVSVNFDTYPSRLLEASGGVNVFRTEPLCEFPVEMEEMIEADPEVLLLAGAPGPFRPQHVTDFRRYRVFSKIPIHRIDGKLLSHYGPPTIEALRKLRGIYQGLP